MSCFNESKSPGTWKSSIAISVTKTKRASRLNDYRPITLVSIIMKYFEKLVMQFLFPSVSHLLQPKKSVDDAVITLIQEIAQHTDKLGCYARVMFADFSSAFNTMQTHILLQKLLRMNVPPSLILWKKDFLTDRTQRV